jgi:hypothetical protein
MKKAFEFEDEDEDEFEDEDEDDEELWLIDWLINWLIDWLNASPNVCKMEARTDNLLRAFVRGAITILRK